MIIIIGTLDYKKPANTITIQIARNDAHLSASIVDSDFYLECISVIEENLGPSFDLYRDITVDNSLDVYMLLINNLS